MKLQAQYNKISIVSTMLVLVIAGAGYYFLLQYVLKKQLDERNFTNIINYETSHTLGKLASPTPDHFVPVLYSLGLMDTKDEMEYFYEGAPTIPAFSERSFIIHS